MFYINFYRSFNLRLMDSAPSFVHGPHDHWNGGVVSSPPDVLEIRLISEFWKQWTLIAIFFWQQDFEQDTLGLLPSSPWFGNPFKLFYRHTLFHTAAKVFYRAIAFSRKRGADMDHPPQSVLDMFSFRKLAYANNVLLDPQALIACDSCHTGNLLFSSRGTVVGVKRTIQTNASWRRVDYASRKADLDWVLAVPLSQSIWISQHETLDPDKQLIWVLSRSFQLIMSCHWHQVFGVSNPHCRHVDTKGSSRF